MFMQFDCFASKSNHHGRNMGGVVVFVKHNIAKFFTRLDSDLKHGIVLKIKSGIINAFKDTLYLAMYIPPEGSPVYNNADVKGIDIIEELLTKNYNNNVDLMITGDLNARTACELEYVEINCNASLFEEYSDIFSNNQVSKRSSCDLTSNSFGKRLIELCKTHALYILNGLLARIKTKDNTHF